MNKMKNKKGMALSYIVKMAILGTVLFVVIGGLIYGIFIKGNIAFAGEKTEEVTKNCDEDEAFGLNDQCPCDPNIQKRDKGQSCGTIASQATKNCPILCKPK
ncbi:hypothetical protein HYY71_04285 [Candidatus Woesearchaeota archaeon]|nr:hypothetical protein [Candidatus Woesearchaeota archaeon]